MPRLKILSLMGLSGVHENEHPSAVRVATWLETPMILLAIGVMAAWVLEKEGVLSTNGIRLIDWGLWLFFLIETVVLTWLVRDRWHYLRTNWTNLLIIVAGTPILWGHSYAGAFRTLRLFLILAILFQSSFSIRKALSRRQLGSTLMVVFMITVASGVVISSIDPGIHSIGDGIWWAWVTIATVGYGDVVPVSAAGRLFGAVLILFGLGLFSMLTANFSAFLISEEERRLRREVDVSLKRIHHIEKHLEHQEKILDAIALKLDVEKPVRDQES